MEKRDVYQIVTDKILELLDQGIIPWEKPWRGGAAGMPKNAISKKPYRGINVFMLSMTAELAGYASPYWLTYKQAEQLGGNVKKGEKASLVVFWKWLEVEEEKSDGSKKIDTIPMLRYYHVFNAAQCENIDIPTQAQPEQPDIVFSPIDACENIIEHMPKRPPISNDGNGRAYYDVMADSVHLPAKEKFVNVEEYYSTLFHELAHSTGAEHRLNRLADKKCAAFGSTDYGKEELVAEMTAAMLCGIAGIENTTIPTSAAYIDSWRRTIKQDKKIVVLSAAAAQRAADYIRDIKFDKAGE